MDQNSSDADLIRNLDLAADVFLVRFSFVTIFVFDNDFCAVFLQSPSATEQERKAAEQYFLDLRNSKLSFHVTRFILGTSVLEF